jgi:hypothetical protein
MAVPVEKRDPALVLVLSFFTCGFYLIYWYYKVYEEFQTLIGQTPTGQAYWFDFILNIFTCGIYGIWVDYQISQRLNELQGSRGIVGPDSTTLAVMLDVAAYFTGMLTNVVTSAVQQDQLNKFVEPAAPYRGV